MTDEFADLDLRKALKEVHRGELIKPALRTFLFDAEYPEDFAVHFRKEQTRAPDGWFWPSTHPLWSPLMLYTYLTAPHRLPTEHREYGNTMSLVMGTAIHAFVEMCLTVMGLRPAAMNVCTSCPPEKGCKEPGFADEDTGSRGHMDGLLDLSEILPKVARFLERTDGLDYPGFEFKCLAPETPVSMADGSLRPAVDVRPGDEVLAWDEQAERLIPRKVKHVWDNGIVPVWRITTKAGREIGVTEEHPFLTHRGWVLARDLRPGDKVRVAFDGSWCSGDGGSVEDAYFLGLMVGDGSLTTKSAMLSCADPEVLQWLTSYAADRGVRLVNGGGKWDWRLSGTYGNKGGNPLLGLLQREGLMGTGSRSKFVPPSVWTGGPKVWAAFLSGYFDSDGTVVTKGSYPHLAWASVNRRLLVECQMLLSYLGVRSSIMQVNSRYKGEPHTSWRLLVRDSRAVLAAKEQLTPRSSKASAFAEMAPQVREDGRWVREHQQGWDTIATVKEGLARPTVAMEVEGGTHVTAGIVTHNTLSNQMRAAKIEQGGLDFYRQTWPEYYAQNQEYMRLSGRRAMLVLFLTMGYPWEMVELVVPYDPVAANQVRDKYLAVREAVAKNQAPTCCQRKGCKMYKICQSTGETERAISARYLIGSDGRRGFTH